MRDLTALSILLAHQFALLNHNVVTMLEKEINNVIMETKQGVLDVQLTLDTSVLKEPEIIQYARKLLVVIE